MGIINDAVIDFCKEDKITCLKHCYECGAPLTDKLVEGRMRRVCSRCGEVNYQNPTPSAAAVITDQAGRVLLTRRSVEPGKGMWCLPGGFNEMGESLEDTVMREVFEETGLQVVSLKLADACFKKGGYYGDVQVICYLAEVTDGNLKPGDDADEVRYFDLNEIPPLAFKCHSQFLRTVFGIKPPDGKI